MNLYFCVFCWGFPSLNTVDPWVCWSVSCSVMSDSWVGLLGLTFCPWNSPGKNTGLDCHFLLQEIFLTQRLNLGLLHCRHILYHLIHQGSPCWPLGLDKFFLGERSTGAGAVMCIYGKFSSIPGLYRLVATCGNQKYLTRHCDVLWGTKLMPVENCQSSHSLGSLSVMTHGALLWESRCRLSRSGSQLESPWTTSPEICNNSVQDCLSTPSLNSHDCTVFLFSFQLWEFVFFSLAKAIAQSSHQRMINTVCLSYWTIAR